MKAHQWEIQSVTDQLVEVKRAVKSGNAYLVIVDDSIERPAIEVLRHLMLDPVTSTVPTLTFLLEGNEAEWRNINALCNTEVVLKPLSPTKFVPALEGLLKKWEGKDYAQLRQGSYSLIRQNFGKGVEAFESLQQSREVAGLAAQAMALVHVSEGYPRDAEKVLLECLKRYPSHSMLLLSLARMYIACAMPFMGLRFLKTGLSMFGHSSLILPDLIQANVMMGDFRSALVYLNSLVKTSTFREEARSFIARIHMSQGQHAAAEKVVGPQKYMAIFEDWTRTESVMSKKVS